MSDKLELQRHRDVTEFAHAKAVIAHTEALCAARQAAHDLQEAESQLEIAIHNLAVARINYFEAVGERTGDGSHD